MKNVTLKQIEIVGGLCLLLVIFLVLIVLKSKIASPIHSVAWCQRDFCLFFVQCCFF